MMDKTTLLIIVFMGISFMMAGILITGAVPKIFENSEVLNNAAVLLHEDAARNNQSNIIINEVKDLILNNRLVVEDYFENHSLYILDYVDNQTKRIEELVKNLSKIEQEEQEEQEENKFPYF